ncbi:hypothetical protein LRP50_10075 [Enterovibrio sp. ZSDZ42]|uniref:DUF2066 domain-containing protein n=1 Tax=Enterovibrio gelatinilyticus TaxID=2899819 RepID=A0ABT5QZN3_9GAMM|nr:hypothetical protein [Enterovibrio sp. ZSDZ42]MDD1793473.1 hypothetical protein [Enterovibrio sp. ZSDZ42]
MKRSLALLLILFFVLFGGVSRAITISPDDVASHIADPNSVSAILKATALFDDNKIPQLDTYLASMPTLLREETLTVLARSALDFSHMTPEREKFLVKISHQQPKYLVKSQGNGYWVTMPAFNYAGEAKWVLNRWEIKLLENEANRLLNYDQLSLAKWLSFSSADYALRREALVSLISHLTLPALAKLETLYINDKSMVWSPDNAVLAALTSRTGSDELYNLLWLRRTDNYSLEVLQKLDVPPITELDIDQMIAATVNPVLADTALRQLSSLNPLPDSVKAFLLKKIGDRRQGEAIVVLLAKKGHRGWLLRMQKQASGVTRRNIENGLESVKI